MSKYIDLRVIGEELLATYPASNLYFLLDHGGLPGLHKQLLRSSAQWLSLFSCTKESDVLAVAPILIMAGSKGLLRASRNLCEWVGENGAYTSSVILLSSPLQMDCMRSRLSARLIVRLSENMEAMLRFFDPRVLESLVRIFSDEQAIKFFGLADELRYIDREGKIAVIASHFGYEGEFVSPLVLTQQQEYALLVASEVDQVLDLLRSNVPQAMAKLPVPEQYRFVSQQIDRAKESELCAIWEMAFYTTVVLSKGEKFVEGGNWSRILASLKRNDFELSELL
jgi:hypothetical protein